MCKKKYAMSIRLHIVLSFLAALGFASVLSYGVVYAGIHLVYQGEMSKQVASLLCLFSISLALIFAAIIMWVGAKHLTRPILKVNEAVKKVAEGEFTTQIERPSLCLEQYEFTNEIDELSENFNTMTRELLAMEYMRKDFMSNVSHEFKTPVAAMAGICELLLDGALTKEEENEYLVLLNEQSQRLSRLCENMLNMSRLDHQQIVARTEKVQVDEQIRQCIIMLSEKWIDKEMEFELSLPYQCILTNKDLLFQVWINLIDNAMKYSKEGSTIRITMEEQEEMVEVVIRDEGIGIRKEQIGNIFDKFYQCEKSHKANGNGLGLSIVKRIVELLQGEIACESEFGKGTTMRIFLPKQ